MIEIYRPFIKHTATASVLSAKHRNEMKLNAYLLITIIFQKKKWIQRDSRYLEHKNDKFVNFYYNSGKPHVDVLLEYYYTMYYYCLRSCGEKCDYDDTYESIYRKHVGQCADGDPWKKAYARMHRLYLLKKNYQWYKRHFRKSYVYRLENYDLFVNKKPRKIKNKDMIQFTDYLFKGEQDA